MTNRSSGRLKSAFQKVLTGENRGIKVVCGNKGQAKTSWKQMEKWCRKEKRDIRTIPINLSYCSPQSLLTIEGISVWEIKHDK